MRTQTPSVSVVIPAYNAADLVGDAVASAAGQTCPPREILCVDDGSTDGTAARLAELAGAHPSLVRVLHQPNGGPSAARNRGLAAVTGDYVQFLDADDLLDPRKLEHQLGVITSRPHPPDVVAASYTRVRCTRVQTETSASSVAPLAQDAWTGLLTATLGITSANLYRTSAVRGVGGWREDLLTSEDPDLAFRLLQAGAIIALDRTPLTTLRRRPDSQWNQDKRRSLEGWVELRGRVWRHLRDHALDTPERRAELEAHAYGTLRSLASLDGYTARSAAARFDRAGVPYAPHSEPKRYRWAYQALGLGAAEWLRERVHAARAASVTPPERAV